MSCRRLEDIFTRHLRRWEIVTLKTSSRRLQNMFKLSSPRKMFAEHYLSSEAGNGGVLKEKVFLEILQNLQENTCVFTEPLF